MLFFFINYVGIGLMLSVLETVSPALILLMVALELLGFVFYATAWYILIRATGHTLPFLTCQGITFASIFAGMTMPSGIFLEAARCVLGSKETGLRLGETTATVVLHRILYLAGFLLCMSSALAVLIFQGAITTSATYALALIPIVSIIGLLIMLAISLRPQSLRGVLNPSLRLLKQLLKLMQKQRRLEEKAENFLSDYRSGFRMVISTKAHVFASFAASLGDWLCSVLILWIVVIALGASVSLLVILVTMAIGKMIQMTPIAIPGMLGIYETAVTASLTFFAVPMPVAASATLLSRIVTTWLDLPITGIAAYHYGAKLIMNAV